MTPIGSAATRTAALLSGELDMMYPAPVQDAKRINSSGIAKVLQGPEVRTIFLGMEGEGKLICDPLDLRQHYLKERELHINELFGACRKQGYFMEQALTSQPLDEMLSGFLNMRAEARSR